MYKNTQIIAIQKTIGEGIKSNSWNTSCIKWFILNQDPKNPKTYEIVLDLVYLSSKRQVKVNGELKYSAMVTFGFECDFQISNNIRGRIKQNGLNFDFQLFINGVSFTQLEKNKPQYEGVSTLMIQNVLKDHLEKQRQKVFIGQSESNQPKKMKLQNESQALESFAPSRPKLNTNPVVKNNSPPISEQQKLKQTQKQLLKILKAQKNQKK